MTTQEFSVGQRVVYNDPQGRQVLTTVTKITPNGAVRIKFVSYLLFWDGAAKTGAWHFHSIRPATDEDLAVFHRFSLIRKIKETKWDELTAEKLEAVLALINKE